MSAPQAHVSPSGPAYPGQPGRWEWAAYPGERPQWFWFADPPAQLGATPALSAPATPGSRRGDVWGEFRLRARRLGVLLFVLGLVCSGVVAYDEVTNRGTGQHVALDVDPVDPAAAPAADGGSDPAADPGADPAAVPPAVAPGDASPGDASPGDPAVLDELADTLRTRAQAFADATTTGDVDGALEYVDPSCRDRVRSTLSESLAETANTYAGVRLAVASVRVTDTDGKVAYRVEGTPGEGMAEVEVPSEEMPELWVQRDGHWYRDAAECRA